MTPSLHSDRLELRPGTVSALRAALEGDAALAANLGVTVPASWPPDLYDTDAIRWTLAQIGDESDGGPFGFYYLIHDHTVIGVGGFKGPPNDDGEVELGYGIVTDAQRRGFATEAVRAWAALAFAHRNVRTIVGQTLASLVPSIGVLEKAGFRFVGAGSEEGIPEGERVIRYELSRLDYERDRDARHTVTAP